MTRDASDMGIADGKHRHAVTEGPDYQGAGIDEPVFAYVSEWLVYIFFGLEVRFKKAASMPSCMSGCGAAGPVPNCRNDSVDVRMRGHFLSEEPGVPCQGQKLTKRSMIKRKIAVDRYEMGEPIRDCFDEFRISARIQG